MGSSARSRLADANGRRRQPTGYPHSGQGHELHCRVGVDWLVMFEGFELARLDVGEAELRVRYGGHGPPLLLLHGHPRTHTTWHRVAPILASQFTVVCPDLRGYGESSKPATTANHAPYSKRSMALDCVRLMRALGHRRFCLAGHDRGSYVAYRTALDHPEAVTKLAVLDCVPIAEALSRVDARFAQAWYHWFFFAQPEKPERAILADPDAWYGQTDPGALGRENWEDYQRAINNPATVRAMLEDYRAGLGVDRANDEADRTAGRKIGCPVLVAWSELDDLEELYGDLVAIWGGWATDVRGASIASGHHMAEQAPTQLAETLGAFFS
jgi:haloacetate dehalogenase